MRGRDAGFSGEEQKGKVTRKAQYDEAGGREEREGNEKGK